MGEVFAIPTTETHSALTESLHQFSNLISLKCNYLLFLPISILIFVADPAHIRARSTVDQRRPPLLSLLQYPPRSSSPLLCFLLLLSSTSLPPPTPYLFDD